ncbi:type II secretion system F family protein [Thalassorhabdus alkalitolerans]|uniref:Type II secretion system F family protein n=1 Tax=Thalassorhabdus alkalitolerans TaxID=2282697 RepID=A0ABW0YMQ9_9BACI
MFSLYMGFFTFATLLFYAFFAFRAERKSVEQRIKVYFSDIGDAGEVDDRSFYERVIDPFWKNSKRKFQRKLNKEKATQLEIRLLQAGQPFGFSPVEFKIFQLALLILFPAMGAGYAFLLRADALFLLLIAAASTGAAVLLPKQYLKMKAQKRSKLALKELPDTLDLLTISLEAGLGFDAALSKVVAKKKGVLADEFKVCLEEIRLGKTRKEALSGINERLDVEELKAFIYNVIQAEKLGIGMVSVLRVQTDDIREKRKQRAEEAAMKAPIKMMFPLILFIFPTLFIILLGPAMLQLLESF